MNLLAEIEYGPNIVRVGDETWTKNGREYVLQYSIIGDFKVYLFYS